MLDFKVVIVIQVVTAVLAMHHLNKNHKILLK